MPDRLQERQVGALQVARAPGQQRRVERDDDRPVARRLGAADEARGQLVVLGPVELVPARRRRRPPAAISSSVNDDGGRGDIGSPSRAAPRARRPARPRGGRSTARRPARAAPAPASRCRAPSVRRSRTRDVAQHPRDDPPAARTPRGSRAACPRCRRRRRRSRAAPSSSFSRAARSSASQATGSSGSSTGQPLQVDLVLVVAERDRGLSAHRDPNLSPPAAYACRHARRRRR